jgi:hypothetical protein
MSICCNSSKIDALLEPQDYIILNFRLSRLRKLCLSMFYSFIYWCRSSVMSRVLLQRRAFCRLRRDRNLSCVGPWYSSHSFHPSIHRINRGILVHIHFWQLWLKLGSTFCCFVWLPHANSVFLEHLDNDPVVKLDGELNILTHQYENTSS